MKEKYNISVLKKLVIVFVVIVNMCFGFSGSVEATVASGVANGTVKAAGGVLADPIADFILYVGDSIMDIIHNSILKQENTTIALHPIKNAAIKILKTVFFVVIAAAAVYGMIVAAPALTAWREFEPVEVVATTYQAISGAGKTFKDWPEMEGNIIPFIGGEEEKSEQEPLRLWGKIEDGVIKKAELPVITTQCIRVPILNGHTAAVFVKFNKKPTKEQLIEKLVNFSGLPQELELPSAPKQFIQYLEDDNRPQVQLDVDYENGMGVSIGRLREDKVYDYKFVGLSHNTVRGAAGGAVLCAELLKAKGYIQAK